MNHRKILNTIQLRCDNTVAELLTTATKEMREERKTEFSSDVLLDIVKLVKV